MGAPLLTVACLVLDFDGTILDTEGPIYRSWAELWEQHGVALPMAQWQSVIGTTDVFDPWAELETLIGAPLDAGLRDRRRARRDELLSRHDVRPGVRAWLEEAEDLAVPVGIASASPPAWVEGHLRRLGLLDRFACVVCCDGVVPAKPDPTSFRMACERLGAAPQFSVAVEDSPHGVAAAAGAGMFTVAVPHALTANLDLPGADIVVASLEDLSLADALERAAARVSPPA